MAQYKRTDRLNEQLRQEITLLVRDEVRDPRVGLATITAVQTSRELDHAKVYFTTLGDPEERAEVLTGLRSAAPFLRRELGKRMHIRRVPELHFQIDRVHEEAQRIEPLLHEALPPGSPASADDQEPYQGLAAAAGPGDDALERDGQELDEQDQHDPLHGGGESR
jgi:ribosome-binding factor A